MKFFLLILLGILPWATAHLFQRKKKNPDVWIVTDSKFGVTNDNKATSRPADRVQPAKVKRKKKNVLKRLYKYVVKKLNKHKTDNKMDDWTDRPFVPSERTSQFAGPHTTRDNKMNVSFDGMLKNKLATGLARHTIKDNKMDDSTDRPFVQKEPTSQFAGPRSPGHYPLPRRFLRPPQHAIESTEKPTSQLPGPLWFGETLEEEMAERLGLHTSADEEDWDDVSVVDGDTELARQGNGTFRDVLKGKLALGLASHQSCSNC